MLAVAGSRGICQYKFKQPGLVVLMIKMVTCGCLGHEQPGLISKWYGLFWTRSSVLPKEVRQSMPRQPSNSILIGMIIEDISKYELGDKLKINKDL